ncbi:hypothetical protein ZWY2020_052217 [Hordeum vulgare]|nr:hypothetical protein ZWY2020_052217 [Hordeum vulgare]
MGGEPVTVSAMIPEALGKSEERTFILGRAYYLYAFSSYPLRTWLPSVYHRHNNWYTRRCVLPGPLVLGKGPLNALTPTPNMDRTVSRHSEPSSRTTLMGEQPNLWNHLQLQVAKRRHQGAKPSRRCVLLGKINLLSLE